MGEEQLPVDQQPEAIHVDVQHQEGGQWDVEKARTMADVIRHDDHEADEDNDEGMKQRVDAYPAEVADALHDSLDTPVSEQADAVRAEKQQEVLDDLTIYEELYDLNPQKFANMPTHEFMSLAKKGAELRRLQESCNWAVARTDDELAAIDRSIKEKLPLEETDIDIDDYLNSTEYKLAIDLRDLVDPEKRAHLITPDQRPASEDDLYAVDILVEELLKDKYEQTPHQLAEKYKDLVIRLRQIGLDKQATVKQELAAFMAEHTPEQ